MLNEVSAWEKAIVTRSDKIPLWTASLVGVETR